MKEKTVYTKAELKEFKNLILQKIESAEEDLAILRASTCLLYTSDAADE